MEHFIPFTRFRSGKCYPLSQFQKWIILSPLPGSEVENITPFPNFKSGTFYPLHQVQKWKMLSPFRTAVLILAVESVIDMMMKRIALQPPHRARRIQITISRRLGTRIVRTQAIIMQANNLTEELVDETKEMNGSSSLKLVSNE